MKKILLALLFLTLPSHASAETLTVSAAASLSNAFTELKTEFLKEHKGLDLYTNFASSNNLLRQMEQGAPADIFASADQETMDKAEAAGLIEEKTRVNFVQNALVLVTPKDSSRIQKIEDLPKAEHLAIGSIETVPAGRYAQSVLQQLGLWNSLQDKFVYGEHVRQVLDYVARSEADAGFVYMTDAFIAKEKVNIQAVLPSKEKIIYPIAVTKNSPNKIMAEQFLAFVLSDKGQEILAKYGFSKP